MLGDDPRAFGLPHTGGQPARLNGPLDAFYLRVKVALIAGPSCPRRSGSTMSGRSLPLAVRPKLTARGDPAHDQVVTGIVARLAGLARHAVVLAEAETHLNLARIRGPAGRRAACAGGPHPGTNRKVTVLRQSR